MIYFDQAAAMIPEPEALDFYRARAADAFGNQEAIHGLGYELRRRLAQAAAELGPALADRPLDAVFAGSGTEIFNLFAALARFRRGNIVTSALEHPALLAALKRTGAELRFLPLDPDGFIDPARAAGCFDGDTVLAAVHHVQSEIGVRQDIDALAAWAAERAPQAAFLADTIQSAGKLPLPRRPAFLTVSGHKFGAPGGAALLFEADPQLRDELEALRHRDYRIGRPEPASALTLVFTAQRWRAERDERTAIVGELNRKLRAALTELRLPNRRHPVFTVPEAHASPYILHFRLPGYQAAVLIRMLSARDLYVASGSACQAESRRPSAVLRAIGVPDRDGYSGLRLSFSPRHTAADVESFLAGLQAVLAEY